MHELPKGLAKDLRSWRGSVYSSNSQDDHAVDLEKGIDDYGEKDFERALSPNSSMVLHPTASSHALRHKQQAQQHDGQSSHHDGAQSSQNNSQQKGAHTPTQTVSVLKRQQQPDVQQTPVSVKKSVFTQPKVDDPDPAADRIAAHEDEPLSPAEFYELIGMHQPVRAGQAPKELAMRHALYGKIHRQFEYIQGKYRTFDVATYVALVLQLILSAVFIILGSLSKVDSHIAIAVLGAVSTIIGGLLAVMKGQGLPNRLRQQRDSLRNVLFEAEELYWDVAAGRSVYFKDIIKLREDYLRVMEEARRNHPDTWNSTDKGIAKGVEVTRGKAPSVAAAATPKV